MKKIVVVFIMLISMVGLTACVKENANIFDTSIQDEIEKFY